MHVTRRAQKVWTFSAPQDSSQEEKSSPENAPHVFMTPAEETHTGQIQHNYWGEQFYIYIFSSLNLPNKDPAQEGARS